MCSYLLPDRLTSQLYCDFLEIFIPGPFEILLLAVRQILWFKDFGAPGNG